MEDENIVDPKVQRKQEHAQKWADYADKKDKASAWLQDKVAREQEQARKAQEKALYKQQMAGAKNQMADVSTQQLAESAAAEKAQREQYQKYSEIAGQAIGTSPEDYLNKAQAAAKKYAEQQARDATIQNAKQKLLAARSSGLNPAQAALMSTQATGEAYNQNLNAANQSALNQYGLGMGAIQQQQAMAGQQQQAENTGTLNASNVLSQLRQMDAQERQAIINAILGGIGNVAGIGATMAGGGLFTPNNDNSGAAGGAGAGTGGKVGG